MCMAWHQAWCTHTNSCSLVSVTLSFWKPSLTYTTGSRFWNTEFWLGQAVSYGQYQELVKPPKDTTAQHLPMIQFNSYRWLQALELLPGQAYHYVYLIYYIFWRFHSDFLHTAAHLYEIHVCRFGSVRWVIKIMINVFELVM